MHVCGYARVCCACVCVDMHACGCMCVVCVHGCVCVGLSCLPALLDCSCTRALTPCHGASCPADVADTTEMGEEEEAERPSVLGPMTEPADQARALPLPCQEAVGGHGKCLPWGAAHQAQASEAAPGACEAGGPRQPRGAKTTRRLLGGRPGTAMAGRDPTAFRDP